MTESWVINASPLILYARIDRLDLIEHLAPGVIIPAEVIDEVRSGAQQDETANRAIAWAMRFCHPDMELTASVAQWNLGPGESQVITRCLQGSRWAVLDDRMARRCIKVHGLLMVGSLGIILRAKELGLIDAARPWVYKLRDQGMYAAESLIEGSLSAIGESG